MASSRRTFIRSAAASSLLFPGIVNQLLADSGGAVNPLAPRDPHFPARAKNVIFLFMSGGVSHIDTFDPKPELAKRHGQEIPSDHPSTKDREDYKRIFLKRPDCEFKPYGQSGTEVSSLFPHVAECVDDIALIRSMYTSHANHFNLAMSCRPSVGGTGSAFRRTH